MILQMVIPYCVMTKRIVEGRSVATIAYSSGAGNKVYNFKISDVDMYIMVG